MSNGDSAVYLVVKVAVGSDLAENLRQAASIIEAIEGAEIVEGPENFEILMHPPETSKQELTILDELIEVLGLPSRTRLLLKREYVETVGQLSLFTEEGLMNITNFGPTALGHVKEALAAVGLELHPRSFEYLSTLPIEQLPLSQPMRDKLKSDSFRTIGDLATRKPRLARILDRNQVFSLNAALRKVGVAPLRV